MTERTFDGRPWGRSLSFPKDQLRESARRAGERIAHAATVFATRFVDTLSTTAVSAGLPGSSLLEGRVLAPETLEARRLTRWTNGATAPAGLEEQHNMLWVEPQEVNLTSAIAAEDFFPDALRVALKDIGSAYTQLPLPLNMEQAVVIFPAAAKTPSTSSLAQHHSMLDSAA